MSSEKRSAHVTHLPPPPNLSTDHHGPPPKGWLPWGKTPAPDPDAPPKSFQNPWPSWRSPTLSDAYRAYKLGAALAHPEPAEPGLSRQQSRMEDHPAYDPYKLSDGRDVPKLPYDGWYPVSTYVRPPLAEKYEDDEEDDWREPPVKVVTPHFGGTDGKEEKEMVTWLGHASVLVQVPWKSSRDGMCGIFFDPIFSQRCSPSQYVGPARHLDPPCSISMLPDIHVVCISHDHYDHLDYYSIMDLWKHHQRTVHFFVGMGLKQWFTSSGIPEDRVTELDWWHETILNFPSASHARQEQSYSSRPSPSSYGSTDNIHNTDDGANVDLTLKLVFTPAQHRTGRGLLDHMTNLWGSWCIAVVEKEDRPKMKERGTQGWKGFKLYFAGDTGYRYAGEDTVCPAFAEIAKYYPSPTLSCLPLSTGSSLPFLRSILSLSLDQYTLTSSQHCSPGDAIDIHKLLKSERSLGMHWGTFCEANEARGTRVEFGRKRREKGVGGKWTGEQRNGHEDEDDEQERGDQGWSGRFVVADIGETLTMP